MRRPSRPRRLLHELARFQNCCSPARVEQAFQACGKAVEEIGFSRCGRALWDTPTFRIPIISSNLLLSRFPDDPILRSHPCSAACPERPEGVEWVSSVAKVLVLSFTFGNFWQFRRFWQSLCVSSCPLWLKYWLVYTCADTLSSP